MFEATPGTLEYFLTERYALFTRGPSGDILTVEIHHGPWPLQVAKMEIDVNTVGSAQGIPLAGEPALLHFSRRQDVIVWPLRRAEQVVRRGA